MWFVALECCVQSTIGLRSVWLCWRASQEHFLGQAELRGNWRSGGVLPFGCHCQPSRGAHHPGGVPAEVQALLTPPPALTPSSWPSSTFGLRELQHQEQPTRCSHLPGNGSKHLLHKTGRLYSQEGQQGKTVAVLTFYVVWGTETAELFQRPCTQK